MTWTDTHNENGEPRDLVERWREFTQAPFRWDKSDLETRIPHIECLMADLAALCEELSVRIALGVLEQGVHPLPETIRTNIMIQMKDEHGQPRFPRKERDDATRRS